MSTSQALTRAFESRDAEGFVSWAMAPWDRFVVASAVEGLARGACPFLAALSPSTSREALGRTPSEGFVAVVLRALPDVPAGDVDAFTKFAGRCQSMLHAAEDRKWASAYAALLLGEGVAFVAFMASLVAVMAGVARGTLAAQVLGVLGFGSILLAGAAWNLFRRGRPDAEGSLFPGR